jgi:hypothetical protein
MRQLNRPYYIPESKWIKDMPSYLLEAANLYLPLEEFPFSDVWRDEKSLVLSSQECKIKLLAHWEVHPYDHYDGNWELSIFYGRINAPNGSWGVEREGKLYRCWIPAWNYLLYEYLDLAFPKQRRSDVAVFEEYRGKDKEFPNGIHWRLALEAETWKHYTPELFYLFDLRRPDLWEQYRAWLKTRYLAERRKEEEDERNGLIPYYRVC